MYWTPIHAASFCLLILLVGRLTSEEPREITYSLETLVPADTLARVDVFGSSDFDLAFVSSTSPAITPINSEGEIVASYGSRVEVVLLEGGRILCEQDSLVVMMTNDSIPVPLAPQWHSSCHVLDFFISGKSGSPNLSGRLEGIETGFLGLAFLDDGVWKSGWTKLPIYRYSIESIPPLIFDLNFVQSPIAGIQ